MNEKQKQMFEAQLLGLRDELIQKRMEIDRSWKDLHGKEIEFEENATNEYLASGLGLLDEQEERRIEEIDQALDRLRENVYDVCVSCGKTISEKRLQAVPWTTKCAKCAIDEERQKMRGEGEAFPESGEERPELPPDLQGMSDEELQAAVLDAVRRDGRVPLEELEITSSNQVIILEGLLPDKRFHSHLRQIVDDVLGLRDVDDRIRIDRTAWSRGDRTPGIEAGPQSGSEDSIAGSGTEIIEAVKEGKTIEPADEIIPEKRSGAKE
ncbi:MAG: TraR/DksA C4-type zinc finger protein [Desulfobulbaceae bacterium]|nr:TraR/DksA C4-type zinc finger protein [Desulfobulbaceae bacterium]